MSRLFTAAVALCLCVVGAACNKGNGEAADQSLFELRPVVTANPPPCPAKPSAKGLLLLPRTADGKIAECLELGGAIVTAKDVRSATVGETPAKEPALSVVLGATGSTNLDAFAQRSQGKRLAIVADGTLVSAPVVQFSSFAGRVQVTGLSKEKTDDLFRRLNKMIKEPG